MVIVTGRSVMTGLDTGELPSGYLQYNVQMRIKCSKPVEPTLYINLSGLPTETYIVEKWS